MSSKTHHKMDGTTKSHQQADGAAFKGSKIMANLGVGLKRATYQ